MPKTIRLLICDDHAVVRRGLRSLVGVKPEMELVGEAVDGEECWTEDNIAFLRVIGDILVNALEHVRAEENIIRAKEM